MSEKEVPEVMGKFGAVFGIKGWLKVHSFTEDPESLFDYEPWYFKRQGGKWEAIEIEGSRTHADGYIAKIKGVDVREVAQTFTNAEIGILPSSLPELPEGEYRWRDLIGLQVVTKDGYKMGTIKEFLETGSNDVMVVKAELNDAYEMKERLIPYLDHVVLSVDLENKVMQVEWDPDF